jgi:Protein of unknown function (DUF3102)
MDAMIEASNSLADLAARIRAEHAAAASALRRGAEHAMNAGDLLIEAKARLKHGQWLPWLAEHCSISERTAQLYMRLAKARPEIEANTQHVADLSLRAATAALAPDERERILEEGKAILARLRAAEARVLEEMRRKMERQRAFAIALDQLSPEDRKAALDVIPKKDRKLVRRWRRIDEDDILHAQSLFLATC